MNHDTQPSGGSAFLHRWFTAIEDLSPQEAAGILTRTSRGLFVHCMRQLSFRPRTHTPSRTPSSTRCMKPCVNGYTRRQEAAQAHGRSRGRQDRRESAVAICVRQGLPDSPMPHRGLCRQAMGVKLSANRGCAQPPPSHCAAGTGSAILSVETTKRRYHTVVSQFRRNGK
jgi:hypothetical protein